MLLPPRAAELTFLSTSQHSEADRQFITAAPGRSNPRGALRSPYLRESHSGARRDRPG